jgi:hypothetical protein
MSAMRCTRLSLFLVSGLALLSCWGCATTPRAKAEAPLAEAEAPRTEAASVSKTQRSTCTSWMREQVTGSLIRRCKDGSGSARAESRVVTVTKQQIDDFNRHALGRP